MSVSCPVTMHALISEFGLNSTTERLINEISILGFLEATVIVPESTTQPSPGALFSLHLAFNLELYLPPLERYTRPLFSGDEWTSRVVIWRNCFSSRTQRQRELRSIRSYLAFLIGHGSTTFSIAGTPSFLMKLTTLGTLTA